MSDFRMVPEYRGRVRACVFDWAGMFKEGGGSGDGETNQAVALRFGGGRHGMRLGPFTYMYDVRNISDIRLVTVTLLRPISCFSAPSVQTLYVNVPFTHDSVVD